MTSVNGISPVDVSTDSVSLAFIVSKSVCLVSRCMGPEASVFVDVIGICAAPAWVVCRKAKRIEILGNGDDGGERVVVGVGW